ncbi:MAG: CoA transferase [Acidimicrobiales bacterium]|nr:CoA transferase [Acidimicrobiales bacterium]
MITSSHAAGTETSSRERAGPLAGVRVLDLSRVMAGPTCTQVLADLGAEVIKIERPGLGDDTRQWGPPWLRDRSGTESAESSYYLSANRGKHSVTVDLKRERGQQIVHELAAVSDICIENFKVGALAELGLGYDDLRADNPAIIYVSITGFGQSGPLAQQPGYDYLAQAMGGMMSLNGWPDDQPSGGPIRTGIAIADISTGLYATIGILAALHHRNETGEGQFIDLALLDTQLAMLANQGMYYLVGGEPPARSGAAHPSLAPYQPFDTADGSVIVAVGNDRQFAALCHHLGRPEMAEDPRYRTNPARNANRSTLLDELETEFGRFSSAELLATLPAAGVPAAAVNDVAEAFAEPQARHRQRRIDVPHALGSAPGIANPLHFSQTPIDYPKGPPLLGEDTDRVLTEVLGFDPETIEQLRADGTL